MVPGEPSEWFFKTIWMVPLIHASMFPEGVGGGKRRGSLDAAVFHSGWQLLGRRDAKLVQSNLNSIFCPLMNGSKFWNCFARIKLIAKLLLFSFIQSSVCVR